MKSDSRGALPRPKGTFRVTLTPPTEAQLHGTSLRLVRYTPFRKNLPKNMKKLRKFVKEVISA